MTNQELRARASELAQTIGPLVNDAEQLREDLAEAARNEQPGSLAASVRTAGLVANLTGAQQALRAAADSLSS